MFGRRRGAAVLAAVGVLAGVLAAAVPARAAGWQRVYFASFSAGLPADAHPYDGGRPGGSNCGTWDATQVSVAGGQLVLGQSGAGAAARSAGLALGPGQRYGKWIVRFRATPSTAMKYAFLLWPDSENWPVDGELDFAEDDGGNRDQTRASTASPDPAQPKAALYQSTTTAADFTAWHTAGVEWDPAGVAYTLDGQVWARTTAATPGTSMHLALQVQPTCAGGPGAAAYVDWVAVYRAG